jgi:hypothetical protein
MIKRLIYLFYMWVFILYYIVLGETFKKFHVRWLINLINNCRQSRSIVLSKKKLILILKISYNVCRYKKENWCTFMSYVFVSSIDKKIWKSTSKWDRRNGGQRRCGNLMSCEMFKLRKWLDMTLLFIISRRFPLDFQGWKFGNIKIIK